MAEQQKKFLDLTGLGAVLARVKTAINEAKAAASAPIATADAVGIVKPGNGLNVDAQGALSVSSDYAKTADVSGDIATAKSEAIADAVSQAKQEIIDGAPLAFDTLKEVAAYIEEHKEAATALQQAIGNKANAADVYTKAQSDAALADKANAADVYTKAVADSTFVAESELAALSEADVEALCDSVFKAAGA